MHNLFSAIKKLGGQDAEQQQELHEAASWLEDTPLPRAAVGGAGAAAPASTGSASQPSTVSGLTSGLSMLGSSLPSLDAVAQLRRGLSPEELQAALARREAALSVAKAQASRDWSPEYVPPSIVPQRFKKGTLLRKAALVSPAMILKEVSMARKTKVVCTLGPSCWSEEGLAALVDAGMNVARFNFSHGDHAGHAEVLQRLRKVAAAKGRLLSYALDTKGPEIRTAMLRGGRDIQLTKGQEVCVVAVGPEAYTSWEGYVEEGSGRAVIGLSYAKLCQFLKPGNTILLSDGTITIQVVEILDEQRLLGRCLNSHKLGQRKNCNLPGVLVDLPVLGPKDVEDVACFAAQRGMDYIFASFVQSADDVRCIRKVLAEAGSPHIQVICKIESQAGLANFDDILAAADGIMVARGDLAMEIPPEKVALAQKMIINKCQAFGKLVICATQMMESMIDNPVPSRAEVTDVANAVFDGTGAVMLSGETANGKHPALVVSTMAALLANAELAVDYQEQYHAIRANNAGLDPVSSAESLLAGVCQQALGFCSDKDGDGVIELGEGCLIVVLSGSGTAAQLISKYRPPCPILAVSDNEQALRGLAGYYGIVPCKVESLSQDPEAAVQYGMRCAMEQGILHDGMKVLQVTGPEGSADSTPIITTENLGLGANSFIQKREAPRYRSAFAGNTTAWRLNVKLSKEVLAHNTPASYRGAKIIATLGPATWTLEGMSRLLAADVDVVRLNVKHQTPAENQLLLDMWRAAAQQDWAAQQERLGLTGLVNAEASPVGIMVSIRGHEVRSARLALNQPVDVERGDTVEFEAVGEEYTRWTGGRLGPGRVKIGLSLCNVGLAAKPGDIIQVDDGALKVQVTEVLSATIVLGTALNPHKLREMALVHVKGAFRHEEPGLSARDKADIRFAAQNQVTFVSVPFVRSAADVLAVRRLLDDEGGPDVKVVAQIDTGSAIHNYDDILRVANAIMVSRTNLGMVIRPEKVPLAQKWLVQRARLAARPVLVAGQLMEGMAASPRPSRPEITDVVNAVYDGADAVVLMQETSCGQFAGDCVSTTARIIADAEGTLDHGGNYSFMRNFTPKPLPTIEAAASSAVETVIDCQGCLLAVFSDSSAPVRMAAKYRPGVPLLVVTRQPKVAAACGLIHGAVSAVVGQGGPPLGRNELVKLAVELSRKLSKSAGLPQFLAGDNRSDQMVLLAGPPGDPFLDVHNFNGAQVAALVFGDESASLSQPVGYRGEHTLSMRSTKVGLDLITAPVKSARKTKVVCTLGPSCWSEEGLGALVDAGMNVARFNFSHGDHAGHAEVLQRLRKVIADKDAHHVATMLDTKGPEIRTAMLKGGSIDLKAGQEVCVVAVGPEAYTRWEGYVEEGSGRAVIGLSYANLCRDMRPGGRILLADGSITIKVVEILDEQRLLGRCLNSKTLGQRKNCNLPGVLVDLPVLGPKDVQDVAGFAAQRGMDFVAASFVQSADDVRFIREVLDGAGAQAVKIISKIESWHGVTNFDDILAATDGIMVARGDLAMEVPSEKVALAQKMMTTKANIAGKFVITATQMLESMTTNPLPTRAEMTDVANAVFDGTDAVMLSGETASGAWPTLAVSTMASIVTNAEVGVNSYQHFSYIREFTDRPMNSRQAVLANVARNVVDTDAGLVLLAASGRHSLDASLEYVRHVAKYRPRAPVLLITQDPQLARACAPWYGIIPKVVADVPRSANVLEHELFLEGVVLGAVREGLCPAGSQVVCALQTHQPALAEAVGGFKGTEEAEVPMLRFKVAPGKAEDPRLLHKQAKHSGGGSKLGNTGKQLSSLTSASKLGSMGALANAFSVQPAAGSVVEGAAGAGGGSRVKDSEAYWQKTLSMRNTSIALQDILQDEHSPRKTKVVATLGPSCWSEEGLAALVDAGMNVARFNFSHGDHAGHAEVLQRLRTVAAGKGASISYLLDTKGPEIRTAMLRGGRSLALCRDQEVLLVAVGAGYKTWEGGVNPETGVAEIGISYEKLAQSVAPGNTVKIADGGLSVQVTEVLDAKRVKGVCLNAKSIGQNKNVNLPGVHVDLPVLTSKDINDLVNFAVRHGMDFVAASFVQSGDDVRFIREVLDRSGGSCVKIIAKIENEAGLEHYDDIISVTDGVMVARGDLAMEVPSEKVALAQKMMITKANIAGKFVITATQMLESMTTNPLPTRAEMTDVANAVFDGTDAVMLSGETASGAWPTLAVSTMASIVTNAEVANSYYSSCNFMMVGGGCWTCNCVALFSFCDVADSAAGVRRPALLLLILWCGLIGHANALDATWVRSRTSFTWFLSVLCTRQCASVLLAFLNHLEVCRIRGVV
ncbi:pyruvate kinase [Scenedesmus sp. NREL 46B-D3]|nr:pyruvate kinase [Scenedesmus sp. NREL 46B-D3]